MDLSNALEIIKKACDSVVADGPNRRAIDEAVAVVEGVFTVVTTAGEDAAIAKLEEAKAKKPKKEK